MISIGNRKYRILIYQKANGEAPFENWISALDGSCRTRINYRLARFEDGHFGDFKYLGDGVFEARFFVGPGYRVYFAILGSEVVLLLAGGDKSTQNKDILEAKRFLRDSMENMNANKKS